MLVSLGERWRCVGRDVALGKGTVEEDEEERERVCLICLHVEGVDVASLYGGVQGVVDMLHVDHKASQLLKLDILHTHLARDQYQYSKSSTSLSSIYTEPFYENRIAPVVGSANMNSGACEMTSANSAILREQAWSASRLMWGKSSVEQFVGERKQETRWA